MQFPFHIAALALALLLAIPAAGNDTNKPSAQDFQAILVWATDDEKPPEKDEELKPVEPELKEKFKFFKWKNYFQVGPRHAVSIKSGETREVKLSHKCNLKLRLTKDGLQIGLIGEGKPLWSKSQTLPLKDVLIFGGDDKNATAWMIVLKPE